MTDGAVWINGSLVDPDEASVPVSDHGFTVGDGVYETLRTVGGRPFAVGRHLARLRRSALLVGIEVPRSDRALREVLAQVIGAAAVPEARVRITLTAGPGGPGTRRGDGPPTLVVSAGPLDTWPAEATAVTVPWPRNEMSALAGAKATSLAESVHALAEARRVGASEAILPNTRGDLCEGTGSNVFVALGGELVTPPLTAGCLPGVTRALLLEALPTVDEADVPVPHLSQADEVLLTSTTRGVQPLRALDGRPLPGRQGPWAQASMAALAELWRHDLDP